MNASMMPNPPITAAAQLPLRHHGDCTLLGVTRDLTIYAEEIYGDDGLIAQHALTVEGTTLATVDEAESDDAELHPLDLPPDAIKAKTCWQTMALNFAGPRHRGMREPERTSDLVRPLSIQEKMALVNHLQLDVLPPLLLGIAESYVLAEAQIIAPNLYFVCRRVRLAVALTEAQTDADGYPYDYDTLVFYIAHFYRRDEEPNLINILADLVSTSLRRPMDCLRVGDRLFIADGGEADHPSAIHVWQLELPEELTEEEKLNKKLYG